MGVGQSLAGYPNLSPTPLLFLFPPQRDILVPHIVLKPLTTFFEEACLKRKASSDVHEGVCGSPNSSVLYLQLRS